MRRTIEMWVQQKQDTGQWRPRTAAKALAWAIRFVRFLEDFFRISSINQITKEHLERYKKDKLASQSLATNEREQEYLFSFFRWCVSVGLLLTSPIAHWKRIHRPKPLPRALSLRQIETIFHALSVDTENDIQDRTIIEMLYATAIRQSELIALDIEDVDLALRRVWIRHAKGGKQRILPLISSCRSWLHRYLKDARPQLIRDLRCTSLFIGKAGSRISPAHIDRLMKHLRETTHITPLSSHIFRHSCATHLMDAAVPLPYIQTFLGHSHISTTQRYLTLLSPQLQKNYDLAHPRDKLKVPGEK